MISIYEKEQVLEVLNFWKLIDWLEQNNIPRLTSDDKKFLNNLKQGRVNSKKQSPKKIAIFEEMETLTLNVEEVIENHNETYNQFPVVDDEVHYVIGTLKRNDCVRYLQQYIKNLDEEPELHYSDFDEVAWFTFKTDLEGGYVEESFQLSPILWSIAKWNLKSSDFNLNIENYYKDVKEIEKELVNKCVLQSFLPDLYNQIVMKYVSSTFPKNAYPDSYKKLGEFIYTRYEDEDCKEKIESEDYSDLGRHFFLDDISLLIELINKNEFGDKSAYEKQVIQYILAGANKSKCRNGIALRTTISPKESKEQMLDFFENVLDVRKAPIGKWPAKFMPALMQQIAVNIAIDEDNQAPIFSVNGPPGTGKTTLLKEVVASNVVERTSLLVKLAEKDPDDAFQRRSFKQGPLINKGHAYFEYAPAYYALNNDKINEYGMLVTSCNNAAVENITADLPKLDDILGSLQSSDSDDDGVRRGLKEVESLFNLDESIKESDTNNGEDLYFTAYANKLFSKASLKANCWGIISAPFGKKSNINKYCKEVLKEFLRTYNKTSIRESYKDIYRSERRKFLEQLKLVNEMKDDLGTICSLEKSIPRELLFESKIDSEKLIEGYKKRLLELDEEIKRENLYLMRLKEALPKRKFFVKKPSRERLKEIKDCSEKIQNYERLKADFEDKINAYSSLYEYQRILQKYKQGEFAMVPLDGNFIEEYVSNDEEISTKAQVANPWFFDKYNREREKLFLYACKANKAFVCSSKSVMQNVNNFLIALGMHDEVSEKMTKDDIEECYATLLQTIFLITPVISTTFASAQTFLRNVKKPGMLGTLIVDEAGQAQPQMSVGSLFRCRKAIIVGDPKQIEPVVTAETDIFKQMLSSNFIKYYRNKTISVQGFADYINPFGTYLGEDEERQWVGCPLTVHRRCIDPMFTISNTLSYDGTMKQKTANPKKKVEDTFILDKSYWINVEGDEVAGNKNHFVVAQGEIVLKLLEEKLKKTDDITPKIFIITPFVSIKKSMVEMIRNSELAKNDTRVMDWMEKNIGTVHTFQGQGTDEVIFLLGCDSKSLGAANWVNKNIVNVAATKAKYRFYVIGDESVWSCKPVRVARECIASTITATDLDTMLNHNVTNTDFKANSEILILNVPYTEKDEAKKLGARWNPKIKKWYVKGKENFNKFERWIPKD